MLGRFFVVLLMAGLIGTAPDARAVGSGDYGDAPEGVLAYPSLGVAGFFPTCIGGPAAYIQTGPSPIGTPNAWFGPTWDLEADGNGGVCPPPPYNNDECYRPADLDAGLSIVTSWTIDATLTESPCGPVPVRALGPACGVVFWGSDIDMEVHNTTGGAAWVNFLVDWNQDGQWSGSTACGPGVVREWVLVDVAVPNGYNGLLSALIPTSLPIGPNQGWVWTRFTITDSPVLPQYGLAWTGYGLFDRGEIEDYMLQVGPTGSGQNFEFGDAPEGALAYPGTAVIGKFPTCQAVAPAGVVIHNSVGALYLGNSVDAEGDGNAGNCTFPPYDQDECGPAGGDSGLLLAGSYTIDAALNAAQCQPGAAALGAACGTAVLGTNIDLEIHNNSGADAFLNILVDWNQDGQWAGVSTCPGGSSIAEHCVQNLIVPAGYNGPLSGLAGAITFPLAAGPGYVWMRATLAEAAVPLGWDGSGSFQTGETEDYLLKISAPGLGEWGDAPEDAPAYPSMGVVGAFPTCLGSGTPLSFVHHGLTGGLRIGPNKDFESDGDAGPPCSFPNYDEDECGSTPAGDGGLIAPDAFTIDGALNELPCNPNRVRALGLSCGNGTIGTSLDIFVSNSQNFDAFFNLLVDWNQNGQWGGVPFCAAGIFQPEHLLVNVVVPGGYSGPISTLTGPLGFGIPAQPGYVWVRATLGEHSVPANWDGAAIFDFGETEDYLLYVGAVSGAPEQGLAPPARPHLGPALPNPSSGTTAIHYTLAADGPVRLTVYDVAGRRVREHLDPSQTTGAHTWSWDGRDDSGRAMAPGLYVVRMEAAGQSVTLKVTRVP